MLRLAIALPLCLAATGAMAAPTGLWRTVDDETGQAKSQVRVTESNGVLTGRIEKLLIKPESPVCAVCTDDRKDKPLEGMTIIRNLKAAKDDEGVWEGGEILDPKSGKTYRLKVTETESGRKLEVRGYVGTPLFGRTQVWERIQ